MARPTNGDTTTSFDGRRLRVEIDDAGRVLVDPEHERRLGQQPLHHGQPALAQVAEAGVVVAALGVVEVGDDDRVEPGLGHEVEAFEPAGLVAHLVDLVDGHREAPEREGGGAGEGDAAAAPQLLGQDRGRLRAGPLAQGVRRAARPREDVPGGTARASMRSYSTGHR